MISLLETILYYGFSGFIGFLVLILILWTIGLIEIQI